MGSTEPPAKRPAALAVRTSGEGSCFHDHHALPTGKRRENAAGGVLWLLPGIALAVAALCAAGYCIAAPGGARTALPPPPRPFPWDLVVAIGAMILFVAFLSGAEAALGSVRKTRLRQLADEGTHGAEPALRLLERYPRFLATVQVGITLASMFVAAVAARSPMERLAAWLAREGRDGGIAWLTAYAFDLSFILMILVVGLVELLFGELIPKRIASQRSEQIALRVAGPIEAMAALASPLVWLLTGFSDAVVRALGGTGEAGVSITEEEIKNIVEESEKEGVLEEAETEMIHSVLEFTDIVVREVMVPRIDMVGVEVGRTVDDLLNTVLASGHTRIPIYEETVDNIVGIVHAKDLLRVVRDCPGEADIRSANVMRSVYYVPENMKVDDLLAEFQRTKHQLAVVVDEYGGTAGLVTLEDLLEEIVGPITDEYDVENEPTISFVDENTALVDARMAIDDVNETLGLRLPEEESETLGGFVFGLLGKIPVAGESVEHDGLLIEVVEADSRRVTRVKITRQTETAAPAAEDAPPDDRRG